jgi:hypothetical protein
MLSGAAEFERLFLMSHNLRSRSAEFATSN